MIKVDYSGDEFCPQCTKCLKCHRRPATIDKLYGVLFCLECRVGIRKRRIKNKMRGFHMNETRANYYATPFWKHMGQKPKPWEKTQEKFMKAKGYSYLDMQRLRNYKGKFNNSQMVNKLERGELHEKTADYRRTRDVRELPKNLR